MKLAEAYKARQRIMERMARRARASYYIDKDPYRCTGPGPGHYPTEDNPMRTGRCLCCRKFIGYSQAHGSWREVTMVQAISWGMMGNRRW